MGTSFFHAYGFFITPASGLRERQAYKHAQPFAVLVPGSDITAIQPNRAVGDGKAEAMPAAGPVPGCFHPDERFKKMRQYILGDARPVITHLDDDAA